MAGTGSLETLRQSNRARILAALEARGEASRVELIDVTGLARTTVSSLVGDLLAEGVVVERGAVRRGPAGGRPAVVLSLDPASGAYAGIDFGHDGVRVVVVDRAGSRLGGAHDALNVDAEPDAALEAAAAVTRRLLKGHGVARRRLLRGGARRGAGGGGGDDTTTAEGAGDRPPQLARGRGRRFRAPRSRWTARVADDPSRLGRDRSGRRAARAPWRPGRRRQRRQPRRAG